jgi:hypothetical protein
MTGSWKAGTVRARRYLIALAGAGILTAGCGTVHAGRTQSSGPAVLAAAVSGTSAQTARIAVTTSLQATGVSMSFTETGEFDFANSRGMMTLSFPAGMADVTELFLPPKAYLKTSSPLASLPHGKTWVEEDAGSIESASSEYGPFGTGGSPADILASLTAMAGSVRTLGSTTIRGVPVTEYRVDMDLAKMAAKVPSQDRASFSEYAKSSGNSPIAVDVWVDHQNLVRQVRLSLQVKGESGTPATAGKLTVVVSVDFYDFGVPVRVSAPPASQVASMSGQSAIGLGGITSASAGASALPATSFVPGAPGSAASAAPAPPTEISSPVPVPTMIASPMPY